MTVRNLRDRRRSLVTRAQDIPSIEDDPEGEFWAEHDLAPELLEQLPDAPELNEALGLEPPHQRRRKH